jgi:hypothetical protein
MIVNNGINEALGSPSHLYAGVEAAERVLTNDPVIQKYLRQQTRGPALRPHSPLMTIRTNLRLARVSSRVMLLRWLAIFTRTVSCSVSVND